MSARAPARVNVIDIEKFVDQRIRVKFQGGREFVGTLKGFDGLVNLVLDDAIEYMRGASFRAGAAQGSAPRGGYLTELSTFFLLLSLFSLQTRRILKQQQKRRATLGSSSLGALL